MTVRLRNDPQRFVPRLTAIRWCARWLTYGYATLWFTTLYYAASQAALPEVA